ncbi:hypothetical protein DPX16_21326 [Anabarilius grahami]|uniref:Uncharacterized protein n=1 Tax=Anabarilius grahami TaxID=495550 RepID=A0A3N0XHC6_ANAGA|nr:hypothetical protein DPX16_21326 [Anabarilius grahami]
MGLCDVNGVGIPRIGTSPRRARVHKSTRAREQEHAHQRAFGFTEVVGSVAHVTGLHEINNVTKETTLQRLLCAYLMYLFQCPLQFSTTASSPVLHSSVCLHPSLRVNYTYQYHQDNTTQTKGQREEGQRKDCPRPGLWGKADREDNKESGGEWGEARGIRNQAGTWGAGDSGLARRIVDQMRDIGTGDWSKAGVRGDPGWNQRN